MNCFKVKVFGRTRALIRFDNFNIENFGAQLCGAAR